MPATVLLVHGAFADGSSWNNVIERLRRDGITARAVANPLRGLTADGGYVASIVEQTDGDVVLVGHSDGGAVATYAASSANWFCQRPRGPFVGELGSHPCVGEFGVREFRTTNRGLLSVVDLVEPG